MFFAPERASCSMLLICEGQQQATSRGCTFLSTGATNTSAVFEKSYSPF